MRKYEDLKNIRVDALAQRTYYIPESGKYVGFTQCAFDMNVADKTPEKPACNSEITENENNIVFKSDNFEFVISKKVWRDNSCRKGR